MKFVSEIRKKMLGLVKRLVYGYKATSETYIAYLKSIGVSVGGMFISLLPPRRILIMWTPYSGHWN